MNPRNQNQVWLELLNRVEEHFHDEGAATKNIVTRNEATTTGRDPIAQDFTLLVLQNHVQLILKEISKIRKKRKRRTLIIRVELTFFTPGWSRAWLRGPIGPTR